MNDELADKLRCVRCPKSTYVYGKGQMILIYPASDDNSMINKFRVCMNHITLIKLYMKRPQFMMKPYGMIIIGKPVSNTEWSYTPYSICIPFINRIWSYLNGHNGEVSHYIKAIENNRESNHLSIERFSDENE